MVEHLNYVTSRALAAALENGDLRTWETGLLDFFMGYRGFRHSTMGKSPHQVLMSRPMRLPWRFHAMPRPLLPMDSGEALSRHMVCLAASLKLLQDTARESILKRQIRNMREYNKRKAVVEHGHDDVFFVGDLVWVKNANPRRNKLAMAYDGPLFNTKLVGEQQQAVELSSDGHKHFVRSVEHICHYHKTIRSARSQNAGAPEDVPGGSGHPELDQGTYPEEPFEWSKAVTPEARLQLEKCVAAEQSWRMEFSPLSEHGVPVATGVGMAEPDRQGLGEALAR